MFRHFYDVAKLLENEQAWEIIYSIQSLHDNGPETVAKRFKSLILDNIVEDAVRAFIPFNYYCIFYRIKELYYGFMFIIRHSDYIIHLYYIINTLRKIILITKPTRRSDFGK